MLVRVAQYGILLFPNLAILVSNNPAFSQDSTSSLNWFWKKVSDTEPNSVLILEVCSSVILPLMYDTMYCFIFSVSSFSTYRKSLRKEKSIPVPSKSVPSKILRPSLPNNSCTVKVWFSSKSSLCFSYKFLGMSRLVNSKLFALAIAAL